MTILAHVGATADGYRAELSDGCRLDAPDLLAMAGALHRAGLSAHHINFALRAGQRLLTSGQQVALCAEIRRLGLRRHAWTAAWHAAPRGGVRSRLPRDQSDGNELPEVMGGAGQPRDR
jgi:hypothetical protein